MSDISVNGAIIHNVEGTAKECEELTGLISEVVERANQIKQKYLLGELAAFLEKEASNGSAICRETIGKIETWIADRLDPVQNDVAVERPIDVGDEDAPIGPDEWTSFSPCDRNNYDFLILTHSGQEPVH